MARQSIQHEILLTQGISIGAALGGEVGGSAAKIADAGGRRLSAFLFWGALIRADPGRSEKQKQTVKSVFGTL